MRLTCTACGAHGSAEQFTADTDARRAMETLAGLPAGLGPLVLRYLGLFRPPKRGLTWDRVSKILDELATMIAAGHVERRGKRYSAASELFRAGIQQMLDQRERLELPLANHNYLIAIVAGDSPRAAAAAEEAAEAAKRQASARRPDVETSEQRIARMRREAEEADRRYQLQQQVANALKSTRS